MTNLAVVKLVTQKIIKNSPESLTSSRPTSQLCYQPDGKEPYLDQASQNTTIKEDCKSLPTIIGRCQG